MTAALLKAEEKSATPHPNARKAQLEADGLQEIRIVIKPELAYLIRAMAGKLNDGSITVGQYVKIS